jgi:CBS domain containing-hemolysin-like protein
LDDDSGPSPRNRFALRFFWWGIFICVALFFVNHAVSQDPDSLAAESGAIQSTASTIGENEAAGPVAEAWHVHLPPHVLLIIAFLVGCSAFFSGSESAFFSINKLRLRAMRESGNFAEQRVAKLMEDPGRLLTTILVGNMIVNAFIGVFLGHRVEQVLSLTLGMGGAAAYALAVVITTTVLVFLGEIAPKVFAVHTCVAFARATVFPLVAADRILAPVRDSALGLTNALFRLTRFQELRAAPFITDAEFKSVLTDGEAHGVIEEDERQMIQGILEFTDAMLREILVPRPDVIALPEEATVAEALAVYREHEYSRMPVYREGLDYVRGILLAKDLLPSFAKGDMARTIKGLLRPAHFVPVTMTVQQLVADAQRHRAHLAIVVDEYGGTAGIVTLEDAMEQVVGDIMDEDEFEEVGYLKVADDEYVVEGSLPLDDLNELIGIDLQDEEHETVAGFLMDQTDRILEPGDRFESAGVQFTVEACEGKRVSSVRMKLVPRAETGPEVAPATEPGP